EDHVVRVEIIHLISNSWLLKRSRDSTTLFYNNKENIDKHKQVLYLLFPKICLLSPSIIFYIFELFLFISDNSHINIMIFTCNNFISKFHTNITIFHMYLSTFHFIKN